MGAGIKYRYALSISGRVVDVFTLTPSDRRDYTCIACGRPLRPVMGEIRQKHFRHKEEVVCSSETYLHKLGKMLFYQVYQECLATKTPFEIEYGRPRACVACSDYGPCEFGRDMVKYDLTQGFSHISLETPDNAFIPDLLLQNERGDKLYVEIAVTHFATESKRASGARIIELAIAEETDLQLIATRLLSECDAHVKFFNFRVQVQEGNFSKACKKRVNLFFLWPSGKSVIELMTAIQCKERIQGPQSFYYKIVPVAHHLMYMEAVERAHLQGFKVKSCFLCRYHAKPSTWQWSQDERPIFCKFLKKSCSSNDAAECQYYRPDPKVFVVYPNGDLQAKPYDLQELQPSCALADQLKSPATKESPS